MANATNSAKNNSPILNQIRQMLHDFFEMPPYDQPTLPEEWLARIPLRSWPLASVAVGLGFYGLMLGLAVLDGHTLAWLNQGGYWYWRNSLLLPVMISYLLLIQPPLRRLFINAVKSFLPLLPAAERSRRLLARTYVLKRRREWLAFGIGAMAGWLFDSPWDRPHLAMITYWFVGGGLMYGLVGWTLYTGLNKTRVLAALHDQAQDLNIFKQPAPTGPIIRWSLTLTGCLICGILISVFFVPPEYLLNRAVITIYSIMTLAAALVLIFGRMPRSLIGQISVFRAGILFVAVAGIGTLGFNYFEEWDLGDSFYATIITMTTIGYGDFSPKSDPGRIFTVILSLFAIGIGGYAVSSIAAFIVEGNFRQIIHGKKVYKQINMLEKHIILCGAGRVGKQIAIEFYKTGVPFVVVEQDQAVLDELLRQIEIPYLQGDATQDKTLELAGIERARGLVTALRDDKDNAFVVLSARELAGKFGNPNLRAISRVDQEKHRKKLKKAGADAIISPYAIGGRRMVSVMMRPDVVTFLDEMLQAEQQTGQVLRLEEVYIDKIKNPVLIELIEQDRLRIIDIGQYTGLLVVVVKPGEADEDDPYLYAPKGDTKLQRGDVLIVIGTPEERAKLKEAETPAILEVWLAKAGETMNSWLDKTPLGD